MTPGRKSASVEAATATTIAEAEPGEEAPEEDFGSTTFAVARRGGRREVAAMGPAALRDTLEAYRRPNPRSSAIQLGSTLLLFVAGWLAMWASLAGPYWFTLVLALPTSGMLMRLFILQHDCGHGSLFASPRINRLVGIGLSAMTMTPFDCWKRQHALHHATNGQLDHRGLGDVRTLTVNEYLSLSPWGRWKYRVYRHPLFLFGLGPFLYFLILQRFTRHLPRTWRRERRSVRLTNLMLLVEAAVLVAWVGFGGLLRIHLPLTFFAGACGVFLFYIQHQFDPTYWRRNSQWEFRAAALEGSSYLELPGWLRWLTANIGYHHVHHLDSRVPNYALPDCHRAHPLFQRAARLTLATCWSCARWKLWDEQARRMVTFAEAQACDPGPLKE